MFSRYPGSSSFNPRRPVGGSSHSHFQNEIQMANYQRPIGNYMTNPYLYPQTQPGYYPVNGAYQAQQQVNWLPVQMVPNQSNPAMMVPFSSQNPAQHQYWRATQMNQFQNRFANNNPNMNSGTIISNPWDPAMSTNVSSLISQSIHTMPSSENLNNKEKSS